MYTSTKRRLRFTAVHGATPTDAMRQGLVSGPGETTKFAPWRKRLASAM